MKKKEGWSAFGIFSVSFSVSLAVLLCLVMGVLAATVKPKQAAESSGSVTEAFQYQPGGKEAISVLFIDCRERSGEPFGYTLARFDPEKEKLILIPIPPETVVTVGTKTGTFGKHYDYAGSVNAKKAAESLFLCTVDRYVRIAEPGTVNLIDALGGLVRRFEEGYETETVTVPAGEHLLNGELLYEIAVSPPEGVLKDSWRAELYGELCRQRLEAETVKRLDYLLEAFWNNVDTDLSRFDCSARRRAMEYFLRSEERKVEVFPLAGSWNKKRTEFFPDETAVGELRLLLGAETEE